MEGYTQCDCLMCIASEIYFAKVSVNLPGLGIQLQPGAGEAVSQCQCLPKVYSCDNKFSFKPNVSAVHLPTLDISLQYWKPEVKLYIICAIYIFLILAQLTGIYV